MTRYAIAAQKAVEAIEKRSIRIKLTKGPQAATLYMGMCGEKLLIWLARCETRMARTFEGQAYLNQGGARETRQ